MQENGPAPRTGLAARHAPLLAAWLFLWAVLAWLLPHTIRQTGGRLIYALDDAYIHMTMARNFAFHGVWGLRPEHFTNTSSSPVWTLLLALVYRVTGPDESVPFILDVLAASALVLTAFLLLQPARPSRILTTIALLAIIIWTPVPALVFTGQEHLLHALASTVYLVLLARLLSAGATIGDGRGETSGDGRGVTIRDGRDALPRGFLVLSALLPLVRFEGLFLCGIAAILLFATGRRRAAAVTLAASLAPVAIFGLFSLSRGWLFLPNPVLLKGNLLQPGSLSSLADFARQWYRLAVTTPHLLLLLTTELAFFAWRWNAEVSRGERALPRGSTWAVGIAAAATLLHLQFARARWFFRYEAYLVELGVFALAWGVAEWRCASALAQAGRESEPPPAFPAPAVPRPGSGALPARVAIGILLLFPVAALSDRAAESITRLPQAARNIWEQQYQMGLFLQRYYPGASIAANDLGAITWLAGVDCLDLWGLASNDVARSRLAGRYDRDVIDRLAAAHRCRIAIVYDSWFAPGDFAGIPVGRPGGMPSAWRRAGRWTIENNFVGGDATVTFYAVDPGEETPLTRHLQEFGERLPVTVRQGGEYTGR